MESKTGKSHMIAIQLSFVPGAGVILLNESHAFAFMDGIQKWHVSNDCL